MKYAVIRTGSKQYKVEEQSTIAVEKLEGKPGDRVNFEEVLLLADNGKVRIGQPQLADITVKGKIVSQEKGEKIRVATYKAKSRYRRVIGHRQRLTQVHIDSISTGESSQKKAKK